MVREWRRLQKVDELTYIGECDSEHPQARVFGGHVLAQAMSAAYYTAPEGFYMHAVHCYFIRGGEESIPITYNVKKIRDGRNFAIRYVEAVQHNKVIHLAEFSLQKLASVKDTFSLTPKFPENVPDPDTLVSNISGRHQKISEGYDARDFRGQVTERMAPSLEIRPVDLDLYLHGNEGINKTQLLWIRYKIPVEKSDYMLRHATIVYLSDLELVTTGSLCFSDKRFKLQTSMDHSAWIHQYEFDINDWILYEQECVANSNHRSLIHGRLWSRDGQLIMSTSQEALIYKVQPSKL
ncbi:unnamed protein product [Caenorhabditis angaria]|uniref:Acyl-CoA thioesterase II n=1 Tax=Caenorhabditis angaria TaxID=860376 RepID=A0A9P1I9A9_9PELO|nr:unnamed protein product [Caenorhabditis angaria]